MELTLTFLDYFIKALSLSLPLLILFLLLLIVLGQVVGHLEKWSRFNSFYWTFITALTVGYGDLKPLKKVSKILSIFIALIGILLTGIIVAIAVSTVTLSFQKHISFFTNQG